MECDFLMVSYIVTERFDHGSTCK